jgi:hypothetical protein
MRETFLALALVFSLITTALCQQPQATPVPSQQPTTPPVTVPESDEVIDDVVRITTKLVQVDAVVTDKNGKHVTDLKAEDFEVTENGKPRAITNFSFVTSAPVPSLPGENEQKAVPLTAKERATTPLAPMKQLRPDQVRPSFG